jgi:hypothetical protein
MHIVKIYFGLKVDETIHQISKLTMRDKLTVYLDYPMLAIGLAIQLLDVRYKQLYEWTLCYMYSPMLLWAIWLLVK